MLWCRSSRPTLPTRKRAASGASSWAVSSWARGVTPDCIPQMSALEAGVAYDAMQWRNAKAKAKAETMLKAPREAAPRKRTPAKAGGSAQQNRIAALSNKRQLTIDEAVELHNLKGLQ